ncbi:MAG: hypothetical protein U1C58_10420 [Flavobacteriaceae bacterium]|nr:hypothetical protein [Flavobacteriaceae bacterium]
MYLKQTLIIAFTLSVMSLGAWEFYWRSQGFYPTIDDNKELWATQRVRVENATNKDVVLMGSSRVLFDFQLNEWENETGKRPIQLACVGSSPLPVFHDIVEKTNFTGTVLIGVTPGLFFSTTNPKAQPWEWPQSRVDYYYKRTYAQRLNHALSMLVQESFTFLSEDEGVDGLKLKELVGKIKVGERVPDPMPPFHSFGEIAKDRNLKMKEIAVTDTAYANSIKKVWMFFGKGAPPPDKKSTMAFFLTDLKKFKARGGKVILVRCPSSGGVRIGENMGLPRNKFYDDLVQQARVKAYHFEDYNQFKNLDCPEWSHLSATDAQFFTTELVKIMIKDGALTNYKTN